MKELLFYIFVEIIIATALMLSNLMPEREMALVAASILVVINYTIYLSNNKPIYLIIMLPIMILGLIGRIYFY